MESNKERNREITRFLFKVKIEEVIDLLGVDAACKLYHFYGGAHFYLSRTRSIRSRIRSALIREDYKKLMEERDITAVKAFEILAAKYNLSVYAIKQKVTNKKGLSRISALSDDYLLQLATENAEVFRRYKII